MKIAGYVFAVIGGLALIGGLAAGHSVFGPLFWLALGIVLIYFGKQKEEKNKANEIKGVNQIPTETEVPDLEAKNKTHEICHDEPMTFWETYKKDFPSKAEAISSQINRDFATMSDMDVQETVSSMERMASSLKCDISMVKEKYLEEISKYPTELLPEMIASTSREMDGEAKAYGLSAHNTMTSIMVDWLRERHDDLGRPDAEVTKNANEDEIEIVKELCPDTTEDTDIKERLKSLREASLLWKCPMKDLKKFYISETKQSYDGAYEHFHYLPETLEYFAGKSLETANKAGVKPDNTIYSILFEWLSEFAKEERIRLVDANEVVCPRCMGRNIKLGFFKDEFECNSCGNRFGGL